MDGKMERVDSPDAWPEIAVENMVKTLRSRGRLYPPDIKWLKRHRPELLKEAAG